MPRGEVHNHPFLISTVHEGGFQFRGLSSWPRRSNPRYPFGNVEAFHGILPHVANIDNRSATVLIYKCSLLCNNISIATHTRNSTAPSLLWYGLVKSAQQRTAFSNDQTGVLYRVRLKTSTEIYKEDASVSKDDSDQYRPSAEGKIFKARMSLKKKCVDCITGIKSTSRIVHRLLSRIIWVVVVIEPWPIHSIA
jgi:hypothetical protein